MIVATVSFSLPFANFRETETKKKKKKKKKYIKTLGSHSARRHSPPNRPYSSSALIRTGTTPTPVETTTSLIFHF